MNASGSRATPAATGLAAAILLAALVSGCGDASNASTISDPLLAGPYPVGVTRVVLRDEIRDRTLLTEVWYPADESARGLPPSPARDYLPAGLEFLADNATIPLVAVREAPIAPGGPFPLVAFSHGNNGIRFQNSFQMEHLASHGFVVVAPDHDHNTYFDTTGEFEQLRIDRPLDIRFVLDSFSGFTADPESRFAGWVDTRLPFGVSGHSFGAYTSIAVASQDSRIGAALPMALAGPISEDYSAATFLMLATEDKTIGLDANEAIRETYAQLPGPRFLAEFVDAGHYSFSFACFTGLGIGNGDGCGSGTRFADGSAVTFVDSLRVWRAVDGYSTALFGRYLEGIRGYDDFLATNADPELLILLADPENTAAIQTVPALFAAPR